jgi:ketosteroid isomerase-like protein
MPVDWNHVRFNSRSTNSLASPHQYVFVFAADRSVPVGVFTGTPKGDIMNPRQLAIACALSIAALAGCTASGDNSAQANATAADAQGGIADITERWLELIRQKDAAGIAQLYAEDGRIMPPNAKASVGRAAIQQQWQAMMQAPGFELTFAPAQVIVSSAGDMAIDIGTYRYAQSGPEGQIVDNGKYVVAWRNIGGEWKAVADIFNSDAAPAPE